MQPAPPRSGADSSAALENARACAGATSQSNQAAASRLQARIPSEATIAPFQSPTGGDGCPTRRPESRTLGVDGDETDPEASARRDEQGEFESEAEGCPLAGHAGHSAFDAGRRAIAAGCVVRVRRGLSVSRRPDCTARAATIHCRAVSGSCAATSVCAARVSLGRAPARCATRCRLRKSVTSPSTGCAGITRRIRRSTPPRRAGAPARRRSTDAPRFDTIGFACIGALPTSSRRRSITP